MDEEATCEDSLTALVTQAQDGDEAAFRWLYRSLTPELTRYAQVIVGQDAEDVVAEAWLQITRDLIRFEGDGPAFRRFTLAVARNRARDLLRRRGRRVEEIAQPTSELPEPRTPPGSPGSSEADTAETVGARLAAQELMARVAELPRPQAEAVVLRVVFDLDTKSAAEILGKRPGAVAMALSRGLKGLARQWERPETEAAGR